MLKDLNNILERTTIPHKVKLYINKANDVEKLSLEELKDFLDEVSEFENVVLNNKGKIKNEMRMDYVKLITDLRWRLSQLYEDKEMIEDYLENGDFIVVDLDNLSEEKKNYVFSMEVVKNDMEKEINNIKKMYERYNRLYASNKKNKYDYKKFLRKFKIERRTIYYDPSLRIKINYMKKSPFLSKSRLFFVNNFYKVRNLYIDAKFNIEAYLLKVKNNIKSTFNSKKISLIQLKDKLNVKLKLNFIDVKNKLSKINSKNKESLIKTKDNLKLKLVAVKNKVNEISLKNKESLIKTKDNSKIKLVAAKNIINEISLKNKESLIEIKDKLKAEFIDTKDNFNEFSFKNMETLMEFKDNLKLKINEKYNQKSMVIKSALFSLMVLFGIGGLTVTKNNYDDYSQNNNKTIESEIDDEEIDFSQDSPAQSLQNMNWNTKVSRYNINKNKLIDIRESLEAVTAESTLLEEEKEEIDQVEILIENEENVKDRISIGQEVNIQEGSYFYSNMYDAYFNDNQLVPRYVAESMSRTISSVIVSNGEELKNIKSNDELSFYLENNYEIIGCGVTNQYSVNSSIEGYYRLENIENKEISNIEINEFQKVLK